MPRAKLLKVFFTQAESPGVNLRLFSGIFRHGLAQSIIANRHSVFWTDREPILDERLITKRPLTEVGRALDELKGSPSPWPARLGPRATSRDYRELSRTGWLARSPQRLDVLTVAGLADDFAVLHHRLAA